MITSYFHVDPSDRSNKRRVESQSTLDSRPVRPRVSLQPLPQGDRSSSSRPIRKCRTTHQSTHSQRVRGTSSRQLHSRAPPVVRRTTSQFQTSYQSSIRSFFLSASDARSIPRSYIPPRIIQSDLPIVPEDSNREPTPSSPPLPSAIRSGRP
jgi:hypothetical protein